MSVCNSKESNGVALDNIPAGSDSSGCQKDDLRSMSSDEFLAMERSAELDEPLAPVDIHTSIKEIENPIINGKCYSKYNHKFRVSLTFIIIIGTPVNENRTLIIILNLSQSVAKMIYRKRPKGTITIIVSLLLVMDRPIP